MVYVKQFSHHMSSSVVLTHALLITAFTVSMMTLG